MQDVRVNQSLMDRLLSLGTISIETAGETSRLSMAGMEDPQQVADRFSKPPTNKHSMPEKKLEGRIALVTGASKGLGKAMAIALGEAGATSRWYPGMSRSWNIPRLRSGSEVAMPECSARMWRTRKCHLRWNKKSRAGSGRFRF